MSGIVSGRARVVFVNSHFLHLSKGGLDGKVVAYKDSWTCQSYDLQDWVTFRAKPCETEAAHGVKYRALPSSVKFESKGKIVDGLGTLLKLDENCGQYGFIKANDGSTVYFTASVVRPETKDIRKVFKIGAQIRYRATEQKQNSVQWRAIIVCNKNECIENLVGRQQQKLVEFSPTSKCAGAGAGATIVTSKKSVRTPVAINTYFPVNNTVICQSNNSRAEVNPLANELDSHSSSRSDSPGGDVLATSMLSNSCVPERDVWNSSFSNPNLYQQSAFLYSDADNSYEACITRLTDFSQEIGANLVRLPLTLLQ